MHIESICEAGTVGQTNEDAIFVHADEAMIVAAAIDGSTGRVVAEAIQPLLQAYDPPITGAALAAYTTRDSLAAHLHRSPREMLIAANDALRGKLESVYGTLTPNAVMAREPGLAAYRHDPRYFRLALPACVVTLIKVNRQTHMLQYAHSGDTALFGFKHSGEVNIIAGHDGRVGSGGMFALAKQIQHERGLPHLEDALKDVRIAQRNLEGGLYHNYVDADGNTHPERYVGVINGLPQLADYIQIGEADLRDYAGILVCTDGLMWPAEPDETGQQIQARLRLIRSIIDHDSLHEYYQRLRAEEQTDTTRDRYPRFKIHDDAAGVYVAVAR